MTFAERWLEAVDTYVTDEAEVHEPNWRGNPLEFSDWVLEDPAGTAIVFFAVVDAPDARKANWRRN